MELHRETPREQRTHLDFLERLRKLADRDDDRAQRAAQEESFSKQLGTSQNHGLAGKDDQQR